MADLFEVTPDAATGSARIVAAFPQAATLKVERKLFGTTSMESVRVMDPWKGDKAFGVRDFECPMDEDVEYTITAFDATGAQLRQQMHATVHVAGSTGDWIRPITRPLEGVRVLVESYASQTRAGRVATFDILGRSERMAITSVRGRPKGTLNVLTMTDGERERMINVLRTGEPIVFLTPKDHGVGRQYLVVFDVQEERVVRLAQEQARRWVMSVEEIGYPVGITAQWTFQTWGDLKATKDTWGNLPYSYPNWMAVPETSPNAAPAPGVNNVQTISPSAFGY